jgi:hypothetical protein
MIFAFVSEQDDATGWAGRFNRRVFHPELQQLLHSCTPAGI